MEQEEEAGPGPSKPLLGVTKPFGVFTTLGQRRPTLGGTSSVFPVVYRKVNEGPELGSSQVGKA